MCVFVCKGEEGTGGGGGERWGHSCWALCGCITGWDVCWVVSMTASLASLSDSLRRQITKWEVGAWLSSSFLLSFLSFAYELRGAVYQLWKMPQRGPDQRQALHCVLRWISLPNTLMRLKHKFHKQLFSICLATAIVMLHAIDRIQRGTKWIQKLFCTWMLQHLGGFGGSYPPAGQESSCCYHAGISW